ncbi:MAG: hypothetical protein HY329_22670 [Chloroflexi bacterium]|nr:hypothetical protein [Chloroflexota bacterium]
MRVSTVIGLVAGGLFLLSILMLQRFSFYDVLLVQATVVLVMLAWLAQIWRRR